MGSENTVVPAAPFAVLIQIGAPVVRIPQSGKLVFVLIIIDDQIAVEVYAGDLKVGCLDIVFFFSVHIEDNPGILGPPAGSQRR